MTTGTETPRMQPSRMTATRAFSAMRRGSGKPGKQLPFLSLGMRSSTVPARVSQSRSRWPSPRAGRSALFPPWAAPVSAQTSNSIKPSAARPTISRRTSASGAFSTSARRFIVPVGHWSTSGSLGSRKPEPHPTIDQWPPPSSRLPQRCRGRAAGMMAPSSHTTTGEVTWRTIGNWRRRSHARRVGDPFGSVCRPGRSRSGVALSPARRPAASR
jgi:hypothetical protein